MSLRQYTHHYMHFNPNHSLCSAALIDTIQKSTLTQPRIYGETVLLSATKISYKGPTSLFPSQAFLAPTLAGPLRELNQIVARATGNSPAAIMPLRLWLATVLA